MRILVVNVNTTVAMTEEIAARARAVAAPGTEIVPLTPDFGAAACEGNVDSYLAAAAVMNVVAAHGGPFDAVIQAGFGEHGREGLQEMLRVPVVDITEAAASVACFLGRRYSVVTTVKRTVPLIEDRLALAGLLQRCASIRATDTGVLELGLDTDATVARILEESQRAITEDGAEVICLGCGGMTGLESAITDRLGVPVVDGVAAAVKLAESLVQLGLSTSKVGAYAPDGSPSVRRWPVPVRAAGDPSENGDA